MHGIVRVQVVTCSPTLIQQVMYQLSEFEKTLEDEHSPDILIQDYAEAPHLSEPATIPEYYYYADGWLNIPPHRTCFNLITTPITIYCDKLILPVNFLVHLALLRKKYSLIHSAAVEFEGRRYIFPAFGGIGKTILVAAIVFAGGKLYGDDLAIVNNTKVLGYPIDFSVYPYHMPLLKLSDHSAMRQFKITSILNHVTHFLEGFTSRPIKFFRIALNSLKVHCVNIPPRRVFGEDFLAESGPVDAVYYLSRVVSEDKNLKVDSIDPKALADICANILLHEWHASVQHLQVYSALSTFSLESLYNDTQMIFEHLFSTYPCRSIQIPISLTTEQYKQQVLDILHNQSR